MDAEAATPHTRVTTTRPAISGLRAVYEGKQLAGHIAERGGSWRAIASGGRSLGWHASAKQATHAVLQDRTRSAAEPTQ